MSDAAKSSSSQFQPGNKLWQLRENVGRPRLYDTAEDLWQACVRYFQWCEDSPIYVVELMKYEGEATEVEVPKMRAMTVAGLCLHIGMTRVGWKEQAERGSDFSTVVKSVEEILFEQKFTGAAAGVLNSNIIARDLGLADKAEVAISHETALDIINGKGTD